MSGTTDSTPPALPDLSLPDLESELLGLAGHIAAAECRFLRLLAEFDRRGGWAGVGVRSCAHWLTWRAGMSLRTATEHLRVARALENLPRVTAAFAAGRISYSKVRAITRVTGSDTAALARMAAESRASGTDVDPDRPGPAPAPPGHAEADRTGRGPVAPGRADSGHTHPMSPADTDEQDPPGASTDPGTAHVTSTDDDVPGPGATHRDPAAGRPSDGPMIAPPDPAIDDDRSPGVPSPGSHDATVPTGSSADGGNGVVADPALAEQVLLDLALGGTASHVETVVRAVRRRNIPPADTASRRSLTWYHDADGSLVLRGRFTADDGAVLIAAIEALLPAPARNSSADRPPTPAQVIEQEPGPVGDSPAAQRADALVALARTPDPAAEPVVARGAAQLVVHVDAGTGTARLADGPELPGPTVERLACDARAQLLLDDRARNRLYLGRRSRLASPAQIAALTARDCADGGGCRFPGCDHTRHLHAHHVLSWLRGGPTDIDNLILICSHHHRMVHDHGYRILRRKDGGWLFLRPDGTPVATAGAPLAGDAGTIVDDHAAAGLDIDRLTLTPDWYGDRLDPTPILDALLPPRITAAAA